MEELVALCKRRGFIFQSAESTITESQVKEIISVIIKHTEEIDGITIPGLT